MSLANPVYRSVLEALRSSRNGVVYGGKLRFSHALVVNLLYRTGPYAPRLKQVLTATKEHSVVLASFAFLYKVVVSILTQDKLLGNNHGLIKFVAGALAGWVVYSQHFGVFNPGITHQITLYCYSRVTLAVGKILVDLYLNCRQPQLKMHGRKLPFGDLTDQQSKRFKAKIYNQSWKYFAVLVWASVMFIYDYKPQYLQSSLRHSMAYLYEVDMNSFESWRDYLGLF